MRRITKRCSVLLLLLMCVLMLSACKKEEIKTNQTVKNNGTEKVVEITSEDAESNEKDGTFFNRAQKKIQKSATKLLGGSKTVSISESGKENGTDETEQDNEVIWIPGIW